MVHYIAHLALCVTLLATVQYTATWFNSWRVMYAIHLPIPLWTMHTVMHTYYIFRKTTWHRTNLCTRAYTHACWAGTTFVVALVSAIVFGAMFILAATHAEVLALAVVWTPLGLILVLLVATQYLLLVPAVDIYRVLQIARKNKSV